MTEFKTLMDVVNYFSDEKVCNDYLKTILWKDGASCPYCGCKKVYEYKDGINYKCADCRGRFSIKVGSIFEGSRISLQKWFLAIYMLAYHKKGISSIQLSKDIGVTQKTAWYMLHRLRSAMQTKTFKRLCNVVEIDETYIGGKEKNKHFGKRKKGTQGRSIETKAPVLGFVEKGGEIRAYHVQNVNSQTITSHVLENVALGSTLHTDEYVSYRSLSRFFNHHVVEHGIGEYVKDGCYTNTIEGFWSLCKRSIIGIYHTVSKKHLQRYLLEFTFRYNSKDVQFASVMEQLLQNANTVLPYKQLIGQ